MRRFQTIAAFGLLLGLALPRSLVAQEPAAEAEAAEAAEAEAEARAAEEREHEHVLRAHERALRAQERAEVRHTRALHAHERLARVHARPGAYLGVGLRDVTSDDVDRLGLPRERGALIESVAEGSPAAEAGFLASDVIMSWNGQAIESVAALGRLVRETPAGRSVELGIYRGGSPRTIAVELGDHASMAQALQTRIGPEMRARLEEAREKMREARKHLHEYGEQLRECWVAGRGRMGVRLQGLTDQLAEYFGVEAGGALVASVREDSPAAAAGMRAGDIIVRIGAEAVGGAGEAGRAVRQADAGPIEVALVRNGQERSVTVTLPEREESGCDDALHAPEGHIHIRPEAPAEGGPRSHGLHVRPPAPPAPATTS